MRNFNQYRAKGVSTRQIDAAVQELFLLGYCKINDHAENRKADVLLAKRIKERVRCEHRKDLELIKDFDGLVLILRGGIELKTEIDKPIFWERLKKCFYYLFY